MGGDGSRGGMDPQSINIPPEAGDLVIRIFLSGGVAGDGYIRGRA
jgi:hypothetical protein